MRFPIGSYIVCDNDARPIRGCYSSIYQVIGESCIESADPQHERLSGVDLAAPHWHTFDWTLYCERDRLRIQERPSR